VEVAESAESEEDTEPAGLGQRTLMPVFPLEMVALPMFEIPLHIFEARYRSLFNTLLHGQEGLDEAMVDESSPFLGSGRFVVCYAEDGKMALVGTVVDLHAFELHEDGSLDVEALGLERVRVTKVVQELPYMIAEVEPLEDVEDVAEEGDESLEELAASVAALFNSLLQLTTRLYNEPTMEEMPDEVR
jgi:Lon protease-like protein